MGELVSRPQGDPNNNTRQPIAVHDLHAASQRTLSQLNVANNHVSQLANTGLSHAQLGRSGDVGSAAPLPRIHAVDVSPPRPANDDSPPLVTHTATQNSKSTASSNMPQSRVAASFSTQGASAYGVTCSTLSGQANTPLSISVPLYSATSQHHLPVSPRPLALPSSRSAYMPVSPPKRVGLDSHEWPASVPSVVESAPSGPQRQSSTGGWAGSTYQPPQLLKTAQRAFLYKPTYEAISPVSDDDAAPDDGTKQLLANGKTIVFGAPPVAPSLPAASVDAAPFTGLAPPTLGSSTSSGASKARKDELLKLVNAIEQNVRNHESQTAKLRSHEQELTAKRRRREAGTAAGDEPADVEDSEQDFKAFSFIPALHVYAVNRKRLAHAARNDQTMPLYRQPGDVPNLEYERRRYTGFKPRLVALVRARKAAERERERCLREKYDSMYSAWQSRLERFEKLPKRKERQVRRRDLYEKQFSELRKQREDEDRLERLLAGRSPEQLLAELAPGGASSANVAAAHTEALQLVSELNEKLELERKLRESVIATPVLLSQGMRKIRFINRNGLLNNPARTLEEYRESVVWTDAERDLFREKYVQRPKQFGWIAAHLPTKTVRDCVDFYYRTKKRENYKLLCRQRTVRARRAQRDRQQQTAAAAAAAVASSMPAAGRTNQPQPAVQPASTVATEPANDQLAAQNQTNKTPPDQPKRAVCDEPDGNDEPSEVVCCLRTCRAPRRRVRASRSLPPRWHELPERVRLSIANQYGVALGEQQPDDLHAVRTCSTCFNKLQKRVVAELRKLDRKRSRPGAANASLCEPVSDADTIDADVDPDADELDGDSADSTSPDTLNTVVPVAVAVAAAAVAEPVRQVALSCPKKRLLDKFVADERTRMPTTADERVRLTMRQLLDNTVERAMEPTVTPGPCPCPPVDQAATAAPVLTPHLVGPFPPIFAVLDLDARNQMRVTNTNTNTNTNTATPIPVQPTESLLSKPSTYGTPTTTPTPAAPAKANPQCGSITLGIPKYGPHALSSAATSTSTLTTVSMSTRLPADSLPRTACSILFDNLAAAHLLEESQWSANGKLSVPASTAPPLISTPLQPRALPQANRPASRDGSTQLLNVDCSTPSKCKSSLSPSPAPASARGVSPLATLKTSPGAVRGTSPLALPVAPKRDEPSAPVPIATVTQKSSRDEALRTVLTTGFRERGFTDTFVRKPKHKHMQKAGVDNDSTPTSTPGESVRRNGNGAAVAGNASSSATNLTASSLIEAIIFNGMNDSDENEQVEHIRRRAFTFSDRCSHPQNATPASQTSASSSQSTMLASAAHTGQTRSLASSEYRDLRRELGAASVHAAAAAAARLRRDADAKQSALTDTSRADASMKPHRLMAAKYEQESSRPASAQLVTSATDCPTPPRASGLTFGAHLNNIVMLSYAEGSEQSDEARGKCDATLMKTTEPARPARTGSSNANTMLRNFLTSSSNDALLPDAARTKLDAVPDFLRPRTLSCVASSGSRSATHTPLSHTQSPHVPAPAPAPTPTTTVMSVKTSSPNVTTPTCTPTPTPAVNSNRQRDRAHTVSKRPLEQPAVGPQPNKIPHNSVQPSLPSGIATLLPGVTLAAAVSQQQQQQQQQQLNASVANLLAAMSNQNAALPNLLLSHPEVLRMYGVPHLFSAAPAADPTGSFPLNMAALAQAASLCSPHVGLTPFLRATVQPPLAAAMPPMQSRAVAGVSQYEALSDDENK